MKTTLKLVAVAGVTALMLAAVAACGRKEEGKGADRAAETTTTSAVATATATASCDMLTEHGACNEYRGRASFGLEKSLCEGYKGKFANTGCATNGQLGACLMSDGEIKRYYGAKLAGDRALTVEEAKADCESTPAKGTFTASR